MRQRVYLWLNSRFLGDSYGCWSGPEVYKCLPKEITIKEQYYRLVHWQGIPDHNHNSGGSDWLSCPWPFWGIWFYLLVQIITYFLFINHDLIFLIMWGNFLSPKCLPMIRGWQVSILASYIYHNLKLHCLLVKGSCFQMSWINLYVWLMGVCRKHLAIPSRVIGSF